MKKILIGIVLGVLVFVPIIIYAGELRSGVTVSGYVKIENGRAERFVDDENGIVCWTVVGFSGQNTDISCVKK